MVPRGPLSPICGKATWRVRCGEGPVDRSLGYRSSAQAASSDRAARRGDDELGSDGHVDGGVNERMGARVELAIEATHPAVEGEVGAQASVPAATRPYRRPALDVDD